MFDPNKNPVRQTVDTQHNFSMAGVSVATVKYVDPVRRVVVVTTVNNKRLEIPNAEALGPDGEGNGFLPPSGKGWLAVVNNADEGNPYVIRYIPPKSVAIAEENQLDKTPESGGKTKDLSRSITKKDKTYRAYKVGTKNTKQNNRGNSYYDAIAGDWWVHSLERNGIEILRGGVNRLYADPLCQIVQFQEDHTTHIVSRNLEMMTDWGVVRQVNNKGKTRLELRGNTGTNEEYKTKDGKYQFNMEIGECTNNKFFLTLEIKTDKGESVLLTIDKQGSIILKSPKDMWIDTKEDMMQTIGANLGVFAGKKVTIDAGDIIELISGASITENSDGTITTTTHGSGAVYNGNKAKVGQFGPAVKQFQPVVRKDHLDKFNELCDLLADLFLSVFSGDAGVPLSIALRTATLDKALKLKTTMKDLNNYTDSLEAN